MEFPVRCMSCGQVIDDKWEEYQERVEEDGEEKGEVLDDLNVDKYCCRTIFLTHVDYADEVAEHKVA